MKVLLTGATGGLGPVLGRTLLDAGMEVHGTARRTEGIELPFPLHPMDVTDDASVAAGVEKVLASAGRIDAVVNCVNRMFIGGTEEATVDEVRALYDVNVFGALRVCRAVLPAMRSQGRGVIVNMSSLGGILAVPYMGAYTSAKFALEAMSEALYHEVKPAGIDVVIMQPVAMHLDRPDTGDHLHVVPGAAPDSPSHRMLTRMARDTEVSKLTPETVSAKIAEVLQSPSSKRPLRVPMDRAKALGVVKRFAPQALLDRLIAGLIPH